jgi:hypothetical protein
MEKLEIIKKIKATLTQPEVPPTTGILHDVRMMGYDYDENYINLALIANQEKLTTKENKQLLDPLADLEVETGTTINCCLAARPWWEKVRNFNPYNEIMQTGSILWQPKEVLANA